MALYRCAACGSPNVVTDTQAGRTEYNYLKGAVGTVILGAGGAAAGIGSKQQEVFKCPDCGTALTFPMSEEIKSIIDIGVTSAAVREKLTLWNVPVTWDYLKQKYKNIEEGAGDAALKMQAEAEAKRTEIQSEINREIAAQIIKRMQAIDVELKIDEHSADNIDELQQLWAKEAESIITARDKAYEEKLLALNATLTEKVASIKKEADNAENNRVEKEAALKAEQSVLTKKLPTLGVLKFGEKQKIKKRLEEIDEVLSVLATEAAEHKKEYEQKTAALQKKNEQKAKTLKKQSDAEYPLSESPYERKERLNQIRQTIEKRKDNSLTEAERNVEEVKDILLLIMQEYDRKMSFSSFADENDTNSVIEICSIISEKYQITEQRLSLLIRKLKEEGKIVRTENKDGIQYFSLP